MNNHNLHRCSQGFHDKSCEVIHEDGDVMYECGSLDHDYPYLELSGWDWDIVQELYEKNGDNAFYCDCGLFINGKDAALTHWGIYEVILMFPKEPFITAVNAGCAATKAYIASCLKRSTKLRIIE